MTRFGRGVGLTVLVLGAASIGTLTARQASPQQRPAFREAVNLVLVDVYPRRDGRIVEGLTRDDFEVFENGVRQVVDGVEFIRVETNRPDVVRRDPDGQRDALQAAADPGNRVFVAFLDTLHTTVTGSHAIRRPLVDAVNRTIRPNDLFGLITQNERPRDLVLGRVLDSIENQLRDHWTWGERHRLIDLGGMLSGLDEHDPVEVQLDVCFTSKVTAAGIEPWYIDDGPARRLYSEVLIERRREDRVITALEDLVVYLGDIREARTVLMVVTDGWLWFPADRSLPEHMTETESTASAQPRLYQPPGGRLTTRDPYGVDRNDCNQELMRLASLDNPRRLLTLIEDARRRSVSIYPINPDGLATDNPPAGDRTQPSSRARPGAIVERYGARVRERIEGLQTLGAGTDAFAVVNTNDLTAGLGRIVEDTAAYYLLGYYSSNLEPDGQYRTIGVNVRQPGLEVRARRGYRAASPAVAPDASERAAVADPMTEVLEAAFGRLARVRRDTALSMHATAAAGMASVVVELAPAQAMAVRAETPVRVDLVGRDGTPAGTAEATIRPGTRGVLVRLRLPEGLAEPVRANATVGTDRNRLQDSITLIEGAGRLVGDAVVFRATPSPRSPLVPVADYLFRRTERVHVEWARLGELDRRDARLLARDGSPLAVPVTLTERDVDGLPVVAADFNLAPLTDGEYAIALTVGQGDTIERRVVAIRVTR